MKLSWFNKGDDVFEVVKKRLSGPDQKMIKRKFEQGVQHSHLDHLRQALKSLNKEKLEAVVKRKDVCQDPEDYNPSLDLLEQYTEDEDSTQLLLNALDQVGLVEIVCLLYPKPSFLKRHWKILGVSCLCVGAGSFFLFYAYEKRSA